MKQYFFDTYAFFRIIEGSKEYQELTNMVGIVTTKFNLMELYYGLLRDYNVDIANKYYDILKEYCLENIDDDVIKMGCVLKRSNRTLSYVDCLGYSIACKLNITFLTGDKEFENMDNVKFIK